MVAGVEDLLAVAVAPLRRAGFGTLELRLAIGGGVDAEVSHGCAAEVIRALAQRVELDGRGVRFVGLQWARKYNHEKMHVRKCVVTMITMALNAQQ